MESAKQRVRVVAARKKEEKKAKESEGGTSSTPKTVTKASKRKPDGSDDSLFRWMVVIPVRFPFRNLSDGLGG